MKMSIRSWGVNMWNYVLADTRFIYSLSSLSSSLWFLPFFLMLLLKY